MKNNLLMALVLMSSVAGIQAMERQGETSSGYVIPRGDVTGSESSDHMQPSFADLDKKIVDLEAKIEGVAQDYFPLGGSVPKSVYLFSKKRKRNTYLSPDPDLLKCTTSAAVAKKMTSRKGRFSRFLARRTFGRTFARAITALEKIPGCDPLKECNRYLNQGQTSRGLGVRRPARLCVRQSARLGVGARRPGCASPPQGLVHRQPGYAPLLLKG